MFNGSRKVLVAYFTRLPNTESGNDLDAVVRGGGPYGEIGDSLENADMDAISSASITVTDEGPKRNVETVAEWIAEYIGGTLLSIETKNMAALLLGIIMSITMLMGCGSTDMC